MRILSAFYDLKVSPVTFDIFEFLYQAEIERLNRELKDRKVVSDFPPTSLNEENLKGAALPNRPGSCNVTLGGTYNWAAYACKTLVQMLFQK